MLRSVTIKNFRCFRSLTLDSLERVNLIAGMNNCGKTALLEAILLYLGSNRPELLIEVNELRGMGKRASQGLGTAIRNVFAKNEELITFESLDTENVLRSLAISRTTRPMPEATRHNEREGAKRSGKEDTQPVMASTEIPRYDVLHLTYKDSETYPGLSSSSEIHLLPDGPVVPIRAIEHHPIAGVMVPSNRLGRENELLIERFSEMDRKGLHEDIVVALRILEPRLKRLSNVLMNGEPVIYGDIGIGPLVPLYLMGEGITRVLSMALAVAATPKGVVLIDEVENGIHHSLLPKIWQSLAETARRFDTQILATTHSWECIVGAHESFSADKTYDFRFYRLEAVDKEIKVFRLDKEALATAIEFGWEVR